MLALAMPVLVEQLLNVLVAFVDTWLAGNFLRGDAYLAAIGLMAYALWLLTSMFAAIAIGATAMTARFVGAGDSALAVRVTNQAMLLGIGLAAATTLCVFFGGEWFVGAVQLKGEAGRLAVRYLAILVPAVPAIMVEQVGIACLRGAGDTVSGLCAMAVVNLVNIVLSFSLVTGAGPMPMMGWDGLAVGTAVAHVVGALIVLALLLRGRAGLRLSWRELRFDANIVGRILRIGWPGGADVMAVLFCHLWFVAIINSLTTAQSTAQAAAHMLGVRIEALAYLPGVAFHVAAATLVGQFLGAGDPRRASRSGWMACLVGGLIMSAAGVLFFFGAEPLTDFFLGESGGEVGKLTVDLLQLVAFSMPVLALSIILTGALRGAGDTRWPLAVTFFGFLAIRIPGAYFLAWEEIRLPLVDWVIPGLGWGVYGAWLAMIADVVVRGLLILARFYHGGWKRIHV